MIKMKNNLNEAKECIKTATTQLLERGEKLDKLEIKSQHLLQETSTMHHQITWTNSNIFWKMIHYVNIFRICYPDAW